MGMGMGNEHWAWPNIMTGFMAVRPATRRASIPTIPNTQDPE